MLLPRKTLYRNLGASPSHEDIILQLTPFSLIILLRSLKILLKVFAEASSMYNIKPLSSYFSANSLASFTSGKHFTGLHYPLMCKDGQPQQAA